MTEIDHKTFSTIDTLRLLGELEHTRFHALSSATNTENEVPYLVLSKDCQDARRDIQKHYFPNIKEKDWCLIKCAARLLQIMEETASSDIDEVKRIRAIIDSTILVATREDISGCENCRKDKNSV